MSQEINLYHAEFRPPRNPLPARTLFVAIALMALAMLSLYGVDRWQVAGRRAQLADLEQRASRLEAQVDALSGQVAGRRQDPGLAAELAGLETRLRALNEAEAAIRAGALGSLSGYSGHFTALSRVRTADAWLTGVSLHGAPVRMDLSGRALSGEAAARYVTALRREPFFAGLSFDSLEIATPAKAAKTAGLEFHLVSQVEPATAVKETQP